MSGYSQPLQQAITDFGADRTFAQIPQKLKEHYGIEVPVNTARQITNGHEASVLKSQPLQTEIPARPGVACLPLPLSHNRPAVRPPPWGSPWWLQSGAPPNQADGPDTNAPPANPCVFNTPPVSSDRLMGHDQFLERDKLKQAEAPVQACSLSVFCAANGDWQTYWENSYSKAA